MKKVAQAFLDVLGWQVIETDEQLDKAVIILAPHTSTWDLILGISMLIATERKINWVAKKEIFQFPFADFLKGIGGIPLDREHCHNTVSAIAKEFKKRKKFLFALSPEGTRASGKYWKSGFYYIALRAKVPIVLGFLDYETKQGGFGVTFEPTGNIESDLEKIRCFYDNIHARHPKKFAPVRFKKLARS